jgi:hypothetical protein
MVAEAIEKDDSGWSHDIADYLTYFEMLATGVNTDVFDLDIIERLAGTRILAIAANYQTWIEFRRAKYSQPRLYQEIVTLADKMQEMRSHKAEDSLASPHLREELRAAGLGANLGHRTRRGLTHELTRVRARTWDSGLGIDHAAANRLVGHLRGMLVLAGRLSTSVIRTKTLACQCGLGIEWGPALRLLRCR